MKYDRLSAQDASFLYAETPAAHMHVGSLVIFEDGGFTEDELHTHIESRLGMVPRFRKKLATVPLGGGRPIWVDDPDFDLRFHIRHTGLPKPGGMEQARRLMGRLMSIPLDRSRPLWEMWLFDLPDGKKGLIQKTHHCLIDGMSGVDLGTVLLDFTETPAPPPKTEPWSPEEPPSKWELYRETWRARITQPGEIVQTLRRARAESQEALEKMRETFKGVVAFGKSMSEVAPKTSLNQPIGPHRRFEVAESDLKTVKAIKNAFKCKVNDVVLAVVAGGLRRILEARGDDVDGLMLRAMVPVSVRDSSKRNTYGNLVSMMTADLPVGEPDPVTRLEFVRDSMAGIKESKQAVGADFWVKVSGYAPPTVLALAGRAVAFQRMFNLCVTNVPGPQFPLYLLGGKMLAAYPFVPLVGTAAVGVAVLSYMGQLHFGVSGDWDTVPDLDVLAVGISESIEELFAAI